MCGIIGIFGQNESKRYALDSLEKITHRGDHGFEMMFSKDAVLGTNRLAIVDIENGRQPAMNEDKTVMVIQNGEIFNHKDLKRDLEEKGHIFKTDSDTETLTHLFEEYGEEMVKKIDSEMFAFVVYDSKNRNILVARDPLGVKPLYYAYDGTGQLYFASELKQLVGINAIEKVETFPAGHYFINGEIKKYFEINKAEELKDEKLAIEDLEKAIVEAVKKRVDTKLPIGVLLSGGVDSSLIMEIANQNHPDVTAIILGYPDSPDFNFAKRLCEEKGYKYQVVSPSENYAENVGEIIYHAETYEPNVIRHCFASDICSKEAKRLGLKIVLVGEGADELFCGYNEFSKVEKNSIQSGSINLLKDLGKSQLQRVDRMSMKNTVETRVPFLDKKIIELATRIYSGLKIKTNGREITTKYILRKVAERFLPDYIAWRYKVPFANGAGMDVGYDFKNQDGGVAKAVLNKKVYLLKEVKEKYQVKTKEEGYYLSRFSEYGFTKLADSEKRIITKEKLYN